MLICLINLVTTRNLHEVQETELIYFDTLENQLSDDIDDVIDCYVYETNKARKSQVLPIVA